MWTRQEHSDMARRRRQGIDRDLCVGGVREEAGYRQRSVRRRSEGGGRI